jgi:hypothetical protein
MMRNRLTKMALAGSSLLFLLTLVGSAHAEPARIAVVATSFVSGVDEESVVNLDEAAGLAADHFFKVKRYTVTIRPLVDPASFRPPAVFEVHVSVWDGVEPGVSGVRVFAITSAEMAALAPFPSPGVTVPPYAGTNSFVRVIRRDRGPKVAIVVNAFIEY